MHFSGLGLFCQGSNKFQFVASSDWAQKLYLFNIYNHLQIVLHIACSCKFIILHAEKDNNLRLLHDIKDTFYVWGKKQQNLQLLDILACNLANKPSFQNLTKSLFGVITELSTKISRSAVFASCIARILNTIYIFMEYCSLLKRYCYVGQKIIHAENHKLLFLFIHLK